MINAIVITITEKQITARRNSQTLVSLTIPAAYFSAGIENPDNHELPLFGTSEAVSLNDNLAIQASITIVPSSELLKSWEEEQEALDEKS